MRGEEETGVRREETSRDAIVACLWPGLALLLAPLAAFACAACLLPTSLGLLGSGLPLGFVPLARFAPVWPAYG